jgi:hypothetical protein
MPGVVNVVVLTLGLKVVFVVVGIVLVVTAI